MSINRGDVYQVRKIKDKRRAADNTWEYLCEWMHYDDETWESADTLRVGAKKILNTFNQKWSLANKQRPSGKRARDK